MESNDNPWTLVTIDDPCFAVGESIKCLLQKIVNLLEFNFVSLDDIIGSSVT